MKLEEKNVLQIMAVFLSKCEELLKLIPDLQCYKCKNVPGPNGTQTNRYSCFDSSHTLCEEHKTECLCRSKVGKSPSPIIANLLQNLPWMCQNYKNGCREIKMNVEDLGHHQGKCIYRQVFCPHSDCQSKEEGKILFKDVLEHLTICMGKPIYEYEMSNEANKFNIVFATKNFGLNEGKSWFPFKMTTTCGGVFFVNGKIENKTVYIWSCLFGSSDESKKYSSTYSVSNKIGQKFLYSGPVQTLDDKSDDIIASGSLLMIGVSAAKRSLNAKKQLEVEITIRNMKEEAKDDEMESGVSDGE